MNSGRLNAKIVLVVAGIFLVGCSGPAKEVLQLADKTAANVGTISAHLRQLSQNSREMAGLRADSIARLHQANAKLRADYEYDVELVRKSGDASNLALIGEIETWTKKVDDIFKKSEDVAEARRKLVLDTQSALDAKSKALSGIAQLLATLAKEDKPKDRVRFLKGFAEDLKSNLDRALKADDAGAKAATKLVDSTKERLTTGLSKAKTRLNTKPTN
jgi:outer membrane murein-binding lipoprotein Lpp